MMIIMSVNIVNISENMILFTVNREIYLTNIISSIVKKNSKYKSIIEKNIALIVDLCKLNKKDLINIEKTTKCKLPNIYDEYIILYSRNGACNTLKKNDIVFSDIDRPNDLKMYKFIDMIKTPKIILFLMN